MNFPLSISDISLWLAFTAIILLATSELLFFSTGYARNVLIEKRRLRQIALALGIGFMITVVIRIFINI